MKRRVKIVVAEPSDIIRTGISSILKGVRSLDANVFEVSAPDQLLNSLASQRPDILLVNASLPGILSLPRIKKEKADPEMKWVALQTSLSDVFDPRHYDDVILISDNAERVEEKILRQIADTPLQEKRQESLSLREKEIISCVVKGMMNKQIAEKLCLSTHTVITHRRNIAAKLDIHSAAGLTIYAIVNKLVELDDIEKEG